ncbi:MAG: DUF2167 domain-containing protein [Gemmatimonadaceae bacterium]
MKPPRIRWLARSLGVLTLVLTSTPASAAAQEQDSSRVKIDWLSGPLKAHLGSVAEVGVPAGCRFADAKGAKDFMEATHNPTDGREVGVLLCRSASSDSSSWWVVFEFEASGIVRDDEKATLDSTAILESITRGTEAGNEERRQRGWEELEILGWFRAPYYDSLTHNLTWSTKLRAKGDPTETVNHSVRILGRRGVMHADLVMAPSEARAAVPEFDKIVASYNYLTGERYSEWKPGDKVAEYGLTALIAGGAGVAAAKLGLFGKLWKVILTAVIALKKLLVVIALGVASFFKRLFGRKRTVISETQPK